MEGIDWFDPMGQKRSEHRNQKQMDWFERFVGLLRIMEDPNGRHTHKCANKKCGFVWEHENSCADNRKAHTCVKCRRIQWTKYFGDGVVAVYRSCLTIITHEKTTPTEIKKRAARKPRSASRAKAGIR